MNLLRPPSTFTQRRPTILVGISKDNFYTRWVGKSRTHKTQSETPLTPEEVETFRMHPEVLLGTDEPELA